ncbi:MalY/PatB family protein [Patulibacter americanus]|uniref:MalY/PatB family protein n=1 Tax=Patulibacter americanus TaxID=588672 RepID=UPI0003B4A87C|nr:aminotransferase class I/II-fold pyridoxal phosphate-dependent enzyme [Patulibacter americanus]
MPFPAVDLSVPGLEELGRRRSAKWAGVAPGVLSSTIAETDFPIPEPVAEALHAAIREDDLGYVPSRPAGLGEAFAGFAQRRWDWEVDPGHVRVLPDVMDGLIELRRLLAGSGGLVGFADPAYPPFHRVLPQAGVAVRPLPLAGESTEDPWALDLDALDAALADGLRVLVLANPHNPTGRALPVAELAAIAERCAAAGAWVLADEIHGPLVLPGATHVPWLTVSDAARECGVVLTSASKAFNLAGLKAALMVTAPGAARDAVAALPDRANRAGLLGVVGARAAFEHGDAYLDALLAQLDHNRTLLGERLAAEVPAARWTPPDATYLAWLDLRDLGLGDHPAAVLHRRGRVALSPGRHYGAPGAGWARLNFGTSPDLVEETVRRMAAAL